MDLWNLIVVVLWTGWEHLLIPILYAIALLIFSVSIAYVLIKTRVKRKSDIQRLRAEVDELGQRLDSIQAMTATVAIELNGPGPFQLPLLTQLNWLVPKGKDRLIAEFRSEDGRRIFAGMSYRAVAQLVNDHRSMPLDKATLSTSSSIDLAKPADAYELPVLPRFEGHLQRGRNLRILVFSSEEGRKILLPLSFDTYNELLRQFEAALVSHQQEIRQH